LCLELEDAEDAADSAVGRNLGLLVGEGRGTRYGHPAEFSGRAPHWGIV
jgi:hypothetical protein